MESITLTVSPQYQITIPKKIREAVGIKPGQELWVWVQNWLKNKAITLTPKPKSLADYTLGLGKGLWGDPDKYIQKERNSWERSWE